MIRLLSGCALTALTAVALVAPVAVHAQQITTQIGGRVANESGAPVAGATVVVTDTRTNQAQTITTDDSGAFTARGLTTGGPYTVTATAAGSQGQSLQNIFTTVSAATDLTFSLTSATAGAADDTIVVTARRAGAQLQAIGPGQAFGTETLEGFPSITRDIRDIIRIDPRVSLDRANEVDRISCLGGNDRANTFTVDGVVQADSFGLNGTPFASRNSLPIPFDAIRETSVEFAPFDVEFGQFTGCAVNVITKSGGNKFSGSAFFTFRNEDLRGDKIDGEDFTSAPFEEKRWGATLSGPILRDRLFFFGAYEETDLGDSQDRGPVGAGFPNSLNFITEPQFNELSQILSSTYGIETGPIARALPESSVRYFGRLDLIISDRHRLEATYQRLEETNVEEDDISTSNFAGLNTFESEGTLSNYYAARLNSNWTDNFSTELRVSQSKVKDVQGPVGGGEAQSDNPIPRIIVGVRNGTSIGTFQAGPGFSRTSNDLDTEINQLKAKGVLQAGNHALTVGGEINQLKVFNLFAQNSTGTLTFNNIDDLRAGLLSGGTNSFPNAADVLAGRAAGAYGNFTASGDINDAAAEFDRTIYTLYAQDEWAATPQLDILAGVRVDFFDGDAPTPNPAFEARYGFSNAVKFSEFGPLFLPRVGFGYDVENDEGFFRQTQLRGGVGIFSGGDPTVYFSNGFSNNGFSVGFGASNNAACDASEVNGRIDVVQNGTFTGVPQCIRTAGSEQSARGLADTQSTDPNFKIPTVFRANFGFDSRFGDGSGGFFDNWRVSADYIYSRFRNPIDFVDLSQVVNPALGLNGFTLDGRPIYRAIDPTVAGCNAELQGTGGTPPRFTNVTAACFNTGRDDEIQLTNGRGYESHVASILLSKSFRGFTEGGNIALNLGYAFTKADNNRFNASSTATSSYDIFAAFDRQNPAVATSEYETRHNATLALNFREKFFGDFNTKFGFLFVARAGRPYSLTFNNGGVFNDSASGNDNALLYIPSGLDDPKIAPAIFNAAGVRTGGSDPAAVRGLIDYASNLRCAGRYAGGTVRRNSCRNSFFYDLDLRFSQELPGPGRLLGVKDRIELFADLDNFLNILDSGWNVFKNRDYAVEIADAGVDSQGRYIITNFNPQDEKIVRTSSSVWRIQVGVRYEF